VHKCSKAYASEFLATYTGHHMAVYSVRWNHLHADTFLSASADWTVKLWDASQDVGAVLTFDMNTCVGDVAWAPYSSTVFAVRRVLGPGSADGTARRARGCGRPREWRGVRECVVGWRRRVAVELSGAVRLQVCTADGKVSVFDLAQNKHEPLCQQKIAKNARLTKIAFNPKHPILLIGDDRGCVTSVKLSPNLRKRSTPDATQKFEDLERAKLEHVIEIALKSRVQEDATLD